MSHPSPDPERLPAPSPLVLPLYKVILLRGEGEEMMLVIRTIMELTRFCVAEATHKMWEAHHNGRSQLLTTHRERAELFAEQFAERGLSVTIEPA
jgi:ATP-dependent Clp protease adapter protein ClpS